MFYVAWYTAPSGSGFWRCGWCREQFGDGLWSRIKRQKREEEQLAMGFVDNYTLSSSAWLTTASGRDVWLPADTIASLWTAPGSRRGQRWTLMPVGGEVRGGYVGEACASNRQAVMDDGWLWARWRAPSTLSAERSAW